MLYYPAPVHTHIDTHKHTHFRTSTHMSETQAEAYITFCWYHIKPKHSNLPPRPPRFDSVQQELNKSSAQNKELQREMERLQSEVTRYKNLQLKASKDCEKYKEERDSVFNEYRLIMSERDQVIKELDKLQTELEAAEARLKNTSSERVVASEELEALRQV